MLKKVSAALGLMVLTMTSALAQVTPPEFDPTTIVTTGKDAITTLIVAVAPVVVGAMAVVIGWRFGLKLFRRLGRSV